MMESSDRKGRRGRSEIELHLAFDQIRRMLASTVFLLTAATFSSVRESFQFNSTGPVPFGRLELLPQDEISLAFKIEPIPDQAMLLYTAGQEDYSQMVKVRKSGKASYSLVSSPVPIALH